MGVSKLVKDIELLNGAIYHWIQILRGEGFEAGPRNCPLCREYFNGDCRGCPVHLKTGKEFCRKTPYDGWFNHQEMKHDERIRMVCCRTCESLAKAEVDFLISLRNEVRSAGPAAYEDGRLIAQKADSPRVNKMFGKVHFDPVNYGVVKVKTYSGESMSDKQFIDQISEVANGLRPIVPSLGLEPYSEELESRGKRMQVESGSEEEFAYRKNRSEAIQKKRDDELKYTKTLAELEQLWTDRMDGVCEGHELSQGIRSSQVRALLMYLVKKGVL